MVISGRVQGVGFRYFTRAAALELGLAGWVRNLADGRVEVHAEGDPAALEVLTERLRRGPRHGRVDRLDVRTCAPEGAGSRSGGGTGFEVRRSG